MSDSSAPTSFIDACLKGEAFLSDIDEWVTAWHTDADPHAADVTLNEYLGFDDDEGALWVERPDALRFIVAAHLHDQPLLQILGSQDDWALAARSKSPAEADAVIGWLRETHRL